MVKIAFGSFNTIYTAFDISFSLRASFIRKSYQKFKTAYGIFARHPRRFLTKILYAVIHF
jgi:hypothetical protein